MKNRSEVERKTRALIALERNYASACQRIIFDALLRASSALFRQFQTFVFLFFFFI